MDVIEEEKIVEKHGIVVRIVKDNETYIVQYTPLNTDSSYDEDKFEVFGGTVGYSTSEFDTEDQARNFFNDISLLDTDKLAERYPEIWVK
jgi:hypothetical protein